MQSTKESLQIAIEQSGSSKKTFGSANQESISINEADQSINEELIATRKELKRIQGELQIKEEALSLAKNDINNMLTSNEVPTLFLNKDLCIRYFTQNTTKLFNLSQADIGRSISDITSNIIYDNFIEDAKKGLHTLTWKRIKVQDQDGNWYSVRIVPYQTGDRVDGLVITFTDISILKQTRKALREERHRTKSYLDVAEVIMLIITANHKVSQINRKGCQILGYNNDDEIIGRNWFDTFITQRLKDQAESIFQKLMSGEIESHEYYENSLLTKNGEEKIIAWHNALLKDENGKVAAVLFSGEDITTLKKIQHQRDESFSDISKEIHNHIKVMMECMDRLKNISVKVVKSDYLNMIGKGINELLELINNVIDFSMIEANQVDLEIKDFDLEILIKGIFKIIAPKLKRNSLELYCNFEEDIPSIFHGDPFRIKQVLLNLLNNATEFTNKGEIAVHVCFDRSDDKSDSNTQNSYQALRI